MHQRQRIVERGDRWVKPDPMLISKLDYMNQHIKNYARREGVPTALGGASSTATPKAYTGSQNAYQRFENVKDARDLPEDPPRILQYLYDKIEQEDWSVPRAWNAYEHKIKVPPPLEAPAPAHLTQSEFDDVEGKVLKVQVAALTQCLAGLGGCVFNWSVGLNTKLRRDLADLIIGYVSPCQHIHTSLELLCFELGTCQINNHERPSKGVQTTWHWTTLPDDEFEEYSAHIGGQFGAEAEHEQFAQEQGGIIHDWNQQWYEMVQEPFVIDNSLLKATGRGLGYRASPDLADMEGSEYFAPWNTVVMGSRVGQDWLCVEGRYLPMHTNGVSVIYRLDDQSYAQLYADQAQLYAEQEPVAPRPADPIQQSLSAPGLQGTGSRSSPQTVQASSSAPYEIADMSSKTLTEQMRREREAQASPGHSPLRGAKRVSIAQGKHR